MLSGGVPIVTMVAKLINTTLSCVPPFAQLAGIAAMAHDLQVRDQRMEDFRQKVQLLVRGLQGIDGVKCLMPGGSFYVFPSVAAVCNRLGVVSHGLAMFLLEGADERRGVACLGGECFGEAGAGFLRFSCAEPDERLQEAVDFMAQAFQRQDRLDAYLAANEKYRLRQPYPV